MSKKLLMVFLCPILIVSLFTGCDDKSSAEPIADYSAKVSVFDEGKEVYSNIITKNDNQLVLPVVVAEVTLCSMQVFTVGHVPYNGVGEGATTYAVYTSRDDYYTIYADVSHNNDLKVELDKDFAPVVAGKFCGTFSDPGDQVLSDISGFVYQNEALIDTIVTDSLGRFHSELEMGTYQIIFRPDECDPEYELEYEFIVDSNYKDYLYRDFYMTCEKPNIYLYPQEKITLDVTISFPESGKVIESIPAYHDGWNGISVEPSGKIDNKFTYLYYESSQPSFYQKKKGWVVAKKELEQFFLENLQKSGFVENEIDDFIEHWIPKLNTHPFFVMYPQYNKELDKLAELHFSVKPDNIIRLSYYIKGLYDNDLEILEPHIPEFNRDGFTVAEWGAVRDKNLYREDFAEGKVE